MDLRTITNDELDDVRLRNRTAADEREDAAIQRVADSVNAALGVQAVSVANLRTMRQLLPIGERLEAGVFHIHPDSLVLAAAHPMNRIKVVGPAGTVEYDFLQDITVANLLALQGNIRLAAREEAIAAGIAV